MADDDEVVVTFTREQFNEVCNVLQLLTVFGIRLYVQGPQPNLHVLTTAFDQMINAGMPSPAAGNDPNIQQVG